jgi:hypothetical protein
LEAGSYAGLTNKSRVAPQNPIANLNSKIKNGGRNGGIK